MVTLSTVREALASRGPLTGSELHAAVDGEVFALWKVCRGSGELLLRVTGRRYVRLDRVVEGFARLSPSILTGGAQHRLVATLIPRSGRPMNIVVLVRTGRCSALFTATRRIGRGTRTLLLRVDSRSALRDVTYTVPALTTASARRGVAGTRIGSLRMRLADGSHVEAVLDLTAGGAHVVLDFVAEQGAENEAFAMTRPAGSCFVIGYGGTLQIPTLDVISTERNIIGNIVGTYNDLVELMALAEAGKVTLHTQTYALDDAVQALHDLDAGTVRGRAILVP